MKKELEQKLATVLKYDAEKDRAPRLTAKGRGVVAEKIIELALKHDIPIRKDPALVQILSKLDIDETIPQELYQVVAEVLAFVYRMNEERREASSSR
jgi:flagellar biosynthesis protein